MALWKITESLEQLQGYLGTAKLPEEIHNPLKQMEWLAARICVKSICEQLTLKYTGVTKNNDGKPLLLNYPMFGLSITHSYPYVAAIISKRAEVGIDVEHPREKLLKLAPRFLSNEELADAGNQIQKICLYWCAKETLFKYYSKGNVVFKEELFIKPFNLQAQGLISGEIMKANTTNPVIMEYEIDTDYVLCYTAEV